MHHLKMLSKIHRFLPIYLGSALSPLAGVGMITILPVLCQTWNMGIQWVGLTITFYLIPFVVLQIISGSIAQVFNTRRTLLFGLAVFALGSLFCGLSPNLRIMLAARFIQGVGAAFVIPIAMALVGEMVDPKNLAKAMGVLGVAYTAGITMGPMIAGYLEVSLGWPWFFFFLMGLALLIGVLYGSTREESGGRIQGSGKISDVLGLARQAFANSNVRYLSLAAFFLFLGYIGLMTFVADYLMVSFALPSDRTGLLLSMGGFFGMLAAPVAGILGDRFGRERIALAGGTIMLGAILGLLTIDYSYQTYLFLFSFFGSGSSAAWTSLNAMAIEAVPSLRKPVSSIYNCFKFSGYAVSPVALSILYVPFSIGAVKLACMACVVVSMLFVSRTRIAPRSLS